MLMEVRLCLGLSKYKAAPGNPVLALFADVWQRLQQSGVLETRDILGACLRVNQSADRNKRMDALKTAVSAPGVRSCTLAGCSARELHVSHFKRCSACRTVVYCSKEHQLEDWPAHKAACKAARKAAAASGGGGSAGPGAAGTHAA